MKKIINFCSIFLLVFLLNIIGVKAKGEIKIESVTVKDKSSTITVDSPSFEDQTIKGNITFNKLNDFVTYEVKIKNTDSKEWKINNISDNNTSDYISIEYNYDKETIKPNEEKKFEVKVSYKKQLLNHDDITLNDLEITLDMQDSDVKGDSTIIPDTFDGIVKYLLVFALSISFIIFIAYKLKNKKVTIALFIVMLSLVFVPFVIKAKTKVEIKMQFDAVVVKGEYESYNIIINPNDGTDATTKTITYGQKLGDLPVNEREGYNFVNWTDQDGNVVDENTIVTKPLELQANYEVINYNITYNLNDGVAVNPASYNIESNTITLNQPTKVGYTFIGWTGSNGEEPQVNVTIETGTTGEKSYTANYTANTNTPYTVIHRYEQLNGTYDVVEQPLTGTTDTTVTPAFIERVENDNPEVQELKILGNGSASLTYTYPRKTFTFSIADRTYIDSTTTADGTYKYGKEITLKAVNRQGYDFTWSDANTNLERTISLTSNLELSANYTAKTNTPYTVIHKYEQLNGTYDVVEQPLTGTTDTTVTPATIARVENNSPEVQELKILGNGSASLTYTYPRKTFTFAITDRTYVDSTTTADGTYGYGKEITLKAVNRKGYNFAWSDADTNLERTITLTSDLELSTIYTAKTDTPYLVIHRYEDVNGDYEEVEQPLAGKTDTTVTPAFIERVENNNPEPQELTITGDGEASITYTYPRKTFAFAIADRTYIDSTTTADGTYRYGKEITLKAINRQGYDFAWSDANTNLERTITLTSNLELSANYTARTDTEYHVIHRYENVDGSFTEVTKNYTGTTDTTVDAIILTDTPYITPETKQITITGDGEASETYTYLRKTFTFAITDRTYIDSTTTADGTYRYGKEITLKAINRQGYDFTWSDNNTNLERTIPLTSNLELSANYTARTDTEYHVIHRYENVDGSFTEVTKNYTGTTDTTVDAIILTDTPYETPETKQITITGDGEASTTYTYLRKTFTFAIIDRTYIDSTTTADGTYRYGTTITLKAVNRAGYDFAWSDANTNLERTFALTSNVELSTSYTAKTHTKYTVVHQTRNLNNNNYTIKDSFDYYGTTDTEVTPDVNTYYGFIAPNTQTVTINGDESTVVTYNYERDSFTLTIVNPDDVETTTPSDNYLYETSITLTAKTKDGYAFTGWSNGETANPYTFTLEEDVTIEALYQNTVCSVTFDTMGGDEIGTISKECNAAVGTLPIPSKENKIFIGWYTDETDGELVDENTVITGNPTFYAHYKSIVCRPATTLHTETCDSTGGCKNAGYTETGSKGTTTITYGSLIDDSNLEAGNAFDCDVNDDDYYDPVNERFYYLRTKDDKAVLYFSSNFEGEDGPKNVNIFLYDDALDELPTATQWNNVPKIDDTNTVTRFITRDDIKAACGDSITATGALDSCVYLFENSRFKSSSTGRTAIWVVKEGSTYYRIHTTNRNIGTVTNTSNNGARPVIEVPLDQIDTSINVVKYTVTFDSKGGSEVEPIEVVKDNVAGFLPESTKYSHNFIGWYTDEEYTNAFTESTIVTAPITVYAKWEYVDAVATINNRYYTSLQTAVTNNSTGKITLLKDTSGTTTIASGKHFELDLNGHTISTNSSNVIKNSGYLDMYNGYITSSASSGAVDNNATGEMYITDVEISNTNNRQALYNNGGYVEVRGNSHLSNVSTRAAAHNLANGTMVIKSGTIESTSTIGAIYNEAGTLTIGQKDDISNKVSPVIIADEYGVNANAKFNFYDGIIKGKNAAISNEANIDKKEDGATLAHEDEGLYHVVYLELAQDRYRIDLDPNGGTVDPEYIAINVGSALGELPEPDKGIYTFLGWYTAKEGGTLVDENTVPDTHTTYYAHWTYEASNEIQTFSLHNNALKSYYQNILTWKTDEDTFQNNMDVNFQANSCMCADNVCNWSGSNMCDRPLSYDTGVDAKIKVYLSNENKEVGKRVYYTLSDNGIIYNLIPDQVYYWELETDPDVYGYVKALGNRRFLNGEGARNVRDLGGMEVDVDGNGTIDGTLKYEKLFRGTKLDSSQSTVTLFQKLGITEEVDLRATSEISSSEAKMPNKKNREIKHYQIDYTTQLSNYNLTRSVVREVMQDVVNGESIYFHCRIGTDRTGTLAYILEGLLGVNDEERLEDYELSYFYGLVNRHRFYSYDASSSVSKTQKFVYMYNFMQTNNDIYDWYMLGSTDTVADQKLISDFRKAMIDYNS